MKDLMMMVMIGGRGLFLSRMVFKYIFGGFALSIIIIGGLIIMCFSIMPAGMQEMVKEAVPQKISKPVNEIYAKGVKIAEKTDKLIFGEEDTYLNRGMKYLGLKVDGGLAYIGKRLVDAIFSPGFLIFVMCLGYLKWNGYINFKPTFIMQGGN